MHESEDVKGGGQINWPIAVISAVICLAVICLAIITAVAGIAFYTGKRGFDVSDRGLDLAGKIGTVFQTKVYVENSSFTLEQSDIAELAVIQRRVVCVSKYKAKWAGSEALVIVKGIYTVKAGYDLGEGYSILLNEADGSVDFILPDPKVLSNTTESQEIFHSSEGILKKLTPDEVAAAYKQNLEQAKAEANNLGLLEEAEARIRERLLDLIGSDVPEVNFGVPVT